MVITTDGTTRMDTLIRRLGTCHSGSTLCVMYWLMQRHALSLIGSYQPIQNEQPHMWGNTTLTNKQINAEINWGYIYYIVYGKKILINFFTID